MDYPCRSMERMWCGHHMTVWCSLSGSRATRSPWRWWLSNRWTSQTTGCSTTMGPWPSPTGAGHPGGKVGGPPPLTTTSPPTPCSQNQIHCCFNSHRKFWGFFTSLLIHYNEFISNHLGFFSSLSLQTFWSHDIWLWWIGIKKSIC